MLLQTHARGVETDGIISAGNFNIKTTAKAFEILSSGIYSNPVHAIIRELSANAYDAHVAAGTTNVPFEITLPSALSPNFSIRDFGTGLSEADVFGLYTTYFDSTKALSNDYIGALGLGSKTPFAYTTTFSVTSWFGGYKTLYNIYVNDDGIPSIAKVFQEASDEPNGLKVELKVKERDRDLGYRGNNFATAVSSLLCFYDVKPVVKGQPNFTFADVKKSIEGDNWFFARDLDAWRQLGITIIQGQVPYKVSDPTELVRAIEGLGSEYSHAVHSCLNIVTSSSSLYMVFPIGEIDVSASREDIRITKATIKSIGNRFLHISQMLAQRVTDLLLPLVTNTTPWTLARNISKFNKGAGASLNLNAVKTLLSTTPNAVLKNIEWHTIGQIPVINVPGEHTYMEVEANRRSKTHYLYPGKYDVVIIQDANYGVKERVKSYMDDKGYNRALVIIPTKKGSLAAAFQYLGIPANIVVRLSDLPKITTERQATGPREPVTPRRLTKVRTGRVRLAAVNVKSFDFKDPAMYIVVDRESNMILDDLGTPFYKLDRVENLLNMVTNAFSADVYHIKTKTPFGGSFYALYPKDAANAAKQHPHWINVGKLIRTRFDHYANVTTALVKYVSFNNITTNKLLAGIAASATEKLATNSRFRIAVEDMRNTLASITDTLKISQRVRHDLYDRYFVDAIYNMGLWGHKAEDNPLNNITIPTIEDIFTHYPLLKFISEELYNNDDGVNALINYVSKIDQELN